MALGTASEFKKHKDTRKVVFKKDFKGANGKVRFAAGTTHYMHKKVAEIIKGTKGADVTISEVEWKKLYAESKEAYKKAVKKSEEAQVG